MSTSDSGSGLKRAALDYHRQPSAGKVQVVATKQLTNQHDLALAYSPGVAAPCEEIVANPDAAFQYTSRGNLVAVISNGSAVLGLGNIGALASKPVMEGKGVLFKKFAGIDVFDIEVDCADPNKLVDIIAALEPTFGGINLEDIKAPDCFVVERELRKRLNIPVFHDDQHGTAIVVCAALLNGLAVVGKELSSVKLVCSGAGAAAIACLNLLLKLGLQRANVVVCDNSGVVYKGRSKGMDAQKAEFAQDTSARSLAEVIVGADVFLGLSVGKVLLPGMAAQMTPDPLILALANPTPEILPEEALRVRPDAVIATGRSDYPNQVNNVLCFPYIFRGALDVRAATINVEMEIAAVHAIAELARAEQSEVVAAAYAGEQHSFGRDYLIPKPFDPRLMTKIAPAVAQAAMTSGVAQAPLADMNSYMQQLQARVFASGTMMKPIFAIAKNAAQQRVAFAEGEEERVLRACQIVIDEQLALPVLIGRPAVIEQRIQRLGLRLRPEDYEVVNVEQDDRYKRFWQAYHQKMARRGVTPQLAQMEMRRRMTLIGAMLLDDNEVDGLICGTMGGTDEHLRYLDQILGKRAGAQTYACMNGLILPDRQLFVVDTHINYDPSAEQLAEISLAAAAGVRRFGLNPQVALLSHSNFGSSQHPSAVKMRAVRELLSAQAPELEVEGEMHGDAALDVKIRSALLSDNRLSEDSANLLVMPNIDAANIAYNLLKSAAGGGIAIGPILLGAARPAHILTPSTTVRRIVNMAAVTVADIVAT